MTTTLPDQPATRDMTAPRRSPMPDLSELFRKTILTFLLGHVFQGAGAKDYSTGRWLECIVRRHCTTVPRIPGIAEFSSADIPDLRASHPEAEHWMSNHFLNNIYRDAFIGKTRQFVVNLLCRAQAQFTQYDHARHTTLEYLSRSSVHSPVPRLYFAAIVQWETCFLSYQIFVDVLVKMGGRKRIFQPNDGSEEQRAYDIANAIKHWAGVISGNQHHDDDTIPLWLTNDGFQTKTLSLTYSELGAITNEVAKTANELQDVRAFKAT